LPIAGAASRGPPQAFDLKAIFSCKISPAASYGLMKGKIYMHHSPLILIVLVAVIVALVFSLAHDSKSPKS
jgi:hypothetical protein